MGVNLPIRFGGLRYDRTVPLELGEVEIDGIDLTYQVLPDVTELFQCVAQTDYFDAAEFSLSSLVMMIARGDDRYVAIPIFPSRCFRHGFVFVNANSGIEDPSHLSGKRVGVEDYHITAAVWVRAVLEHDYGIRPSDVRWRFGGMSRPGHSERLHFPVPHDVELKPVAENQALEPMLETGELDGLLATAVPAAYGSTPSIRRLFPDYQRTERSYYERTGIFPIMHTVVIRRELCERHPWLSLTLTRAFMESKRLATQRIRDLNALALSLPWLSSSLEEIDTVFGGDAYPYGFEPNRTVLDAFVRHSLGQGLAGRLVQPEELFAESTLDLLELA